MAEPLRSISGEEMNELLARRLAQLRKARNLSFDALAARSEISKGMLVSMEKGQANPSIATLCKLAAALRVSMAQLLEQDPRSESSVRVLSHHQANVLWRGPKGGLGSLLVGSAGPDMLELWEWTLHPGESFESKGHPPGTVELLSVREGTLELEIDGGDHLVPAHHCAMAVTDRPHAYRCHGEKRTRFSMVVHEPVIR